MTIVPLTQAALRLGIDVKTLHRWLADAQVPLHPDPQDARKKGVRADHLHSLAARHQRCLTSASADPLTPQPASPAPLPAALLALPETLESLQMQISALQEQIVALTHLLLHPPVPPTAPPQKPRQQGVKATPAAPKGPSPAPVPSKSVHVIPRVEYHPDGHYVVMCPKKGLLPFEPETPEWFAWVKEQDSFRFVGRAGHFTAHHEWRVPNGAWRAHRRIRNRSHIVRLAPNQELTITVLERAAEALQAVLS